MNELMRMEESGEQTKEHEGGFSRRSFLKAVAVAGALSGSLLVDLVQAEDLTTTTLQGMAQELAGVEVSDEEAGNYFPILNFFANGIRGVEVNEEIEPVTVFYRRGDH